LCACFRDQASLDVNRHWILAETDIHLSITASSVLEVKANKAKLEVVVAASVVVFENQCRSKCQYKKGLAALILFVNMKTIWPVENQCHIPLEVLVEQVEKENLCELDCPALC